VFADVVNGSFNDLRHIAANVARDESGYERVDIVRLIIQLRAKRRRLDHVRTASVIQVVAKSFLRHFIVQIPIGCSNHFSLEPPRRDFSYSLKSAFLKDAKKFDLKGRVQFADLVEKNGVANSTDFKPTLFCRRGACERTPCMAE
jgi:hypothetical protein